MLDEEALTPDDVLLGNRIGFRGAANLCFGAGMVLDSELDVLRKEVEEIFCFLFREGAPLCASISASAPDTPFISFALFRVSSASDTMMRIGMGIGTFSAPFAVERTPALVGPEPPMFFFLAIG